MVSSSSHEKHNLVLFFSDFNIFLLDSSGLQPGAHQVQFSGIQIYIMYKGPHLANIGPGSCIQKGRCMHDTEGAFSPFLFPLLSIFLTTHCGGQRFYRRKCLFCAPHAFFQMNYLLLGLLLSFILLESQ